MAEKTSGYRVTTWRTSSLVLGGTIRRGHCSDEPGQIASSIASASRYGSYEFSDNGWVGQALKGDRGWR